MKAHSLFSYTSNFLFSWTFSRTQESTWSAEGWPVENSTIMDLPHVSNDSTNSPDVSFGKHGRLGLCFCRCQHHLKFLWERCKCFRSFFFMLLDAPLWIDWLACCRIYLGALGKSKILNLYSATPLSFLRNECLNVPSEIGTKRSGRATFTKA